MKQNDPKEIKNHFPYFNGFKMRLNDWYKIFARAELDSYLFFVNNEGLISLSNIFTDLAEDIWLDGFEVTLKEYSLSSAGALEPGSYPLSIIKIDNIESDTTNQSSPFIKTVLDSNFTIIANKEGIKLLGLLLLRHSTSQEEIFEMNSDKYLQPGSVKLIFKKYQGKNHE